MRTIPLIVAVVIGIVFCRARKTLPNYFVHNISAERWNKYICESCKYNYHPVCGSDMKTYANLCRLRCASQKQSGLRLLHRGECLSYKHTELSLYAEGCPECSVEPMTLVCGRNEITFYNVCYFECFKQQNGLTNLTIAHPGACFIDHGRHLIRQGETVTCICSRETLRGIFFHRDIAFRVKRICGAMTMYNSCHYNCEAKMKGFTEYPGICDDVEMYKHPSMELTSVKYNPCECGDRNETVCSAIPNRQSQASLKKNTCYSACEREQEVRMKKCYPKKCGCSSEYKPTCALKLFKDVCHFECYREIANPGLLLHGVVRCPVRRQ